MAFILAPLSIAFASEELKEFVEQNGHRFQVHKANTDYKTLKQDYTSTFTPQGECKDLRSYWQDYALSCADAGNVSYHDFMNMEKVQQILGQYSNLYVRIFSYLKPKIEYMSIGSEENAPKIPLVSQENTITETTENGDKQKISDRQTAYVLPLGIINLDKNREKLSDDVIAALQVLQKNGISVNCVFKEHVTVNLSTGHSTHTRELLNTDISATAPDTLLEQYRDAFMLGDNHIAFTAKSKHGTHVLGVYAAVGHKMPQDWGAHGNFLMTEYN
jgi:hypothetical protein